MPGTLTRAYSYNGTVPGPTLDVTEGDHVIVHFTNKLSEPTTVHWHGLHIPVDQDGNPMDPVAPGASRDYVFDVQEGSAGTYWYHPHTDGKTASQTEMGLAGAIRVRGKIDPVPASFGDDIAMLTDNTLDATGAIVPDSMMDQMNGREGTTVFVNGLVRPTLSLKAGETRRLRFINASAARYYLLAIPAHKIVQIGSEGGLFASPLPPQDQILLTPAERIEVLVQASGDPGTSTSLQALPYDRGAMMMMNGGGTMTMPSDLVNLADVVYGGDAPIVSAPIPAALRDVAPLNVTGAKARSFELTEQMAQMQFQINGKSFDKTRVDETAKLGATEVWTLTNKGDMDHPFHVHGFQFQVLDRNGAKEPVVAWKDTVNLKKNDVVRIALTLADFKGMRMYHCHILEHEDQGMMGMIDVQ